MILCTTPSWPFHWLRKKKKKSTDGDESSSGSEIQRGFTVQEASDGIHYEIVTSDGRVLPFRFSDVDSARIWCEESNASRGGVPRIGQPVRGRTITEVPLDDLIPVHPVPRPDVSATHIADIAESIQHGTGRLGSGTKGFNVAESIPVLRMPDGCLVIGGGHHRVASMRHLKESTIPAHITDWADFTLKRRQQIIKRLQGKYPEFFQRHPEYLDPNFGL